MPIYEYKCENGHVFEALQRMADDPLTRCEQCGAPVERVFHPIAVHFKGSGFYTTDYGSGKAAAGSNNDSGSSSDSSGDKSDSGSSEKTSETKSDSKKSESTTKSSSSSSSES
jgi:putative FmdB family regulatory protein